MQVKECGHREDVGRGAVIGDDSCETALNGQCEDGGDGTDYWALDSLGNEVAVCGFATDATDCPIRYVDYGPLTYSDALKPPKPPPPSYDPPSPSPSPPPRAFVSCATSCTWPTSLPNMEVCSDGGLGSYAIDTGTQFEFICNYGEQVCGPLHCCAFPFAATVYRP